ncbi:exported hypothetical protein [Candidatus Accumulibacter aalborgensis]|uniref:Uncharacterized protein n=1 Tax=Candidatus Accumulibacter aalborgensis TaxID=1860102 RepID=A0A1A8XKF8_9PROT|nr:hypothetical protein [Candidatus Accumulibacter aalborgensis]SBT05669.1 exported hypothetical protein [Candidatus Accumulibacter aalborgensis]
MTSRSPRAWSLAQVATGLASVGSALPALAAQPCLNPTIVSPAPQSTKSSLRPTISWRPVAAASSYRIRLVSREPEGRTFATIDTMVKETHFVAPQALSDGFALVEVSVTSQCPTADPSLPAPGSEHRFLIDSRSACPVNGLSVDTSERRIHWQATTGADGYEVFGYEATDGRLLFKLETREPAAVPPSPTANSVILAVRAHCGDMFGQIGYAVY